MSGQGDRRMVDANNAKDSNTDASCEGVFGHGEVQNHGEAQCKHLLLFKGCGGGVVGSVRWSIVCLKWSKKISSAAEVGADFGRPKHCPPAIHKLPSSPGYMVSRPVLRGPHDEEATGIPIPVGGSRAPCLAASGLQPVDLHCIAK